MDSNLQPYPLLSINDFTYSFITDGDIEYYCSFVSYSAYFPGYPEIAPHIYAFNLYPRDRSAKAKSSDRRIADTVITIVAEFLEAQNNAVVYVCDNTDGKEAVRARKFKSWFDYYNHPSHQIIQFNNTLTVSGITIYCAMLLHRKNKRKKEFSSAFFDFTEDEEK
jgi:Family of unknown function (DUF6169)